MKKVFPNKLLSKFLLLTFFSLTLLKGFGQPDTCLRTALAMWVPKFEGINQVIEFNYTKLKNMSVKFNNDQNNRLRLGNFFEMIKYFKNKYKDEFKFMRVYLAAYPERVSVDPEVFQNKLSLIFAPGKDDDATTDLAYYMFRSKFNPLDPSKSIITKDEMDAWTKKFADLMPYEPFDAGEPTNQYPSDTTPGHGPSDTRYITYNAKNLIELLAAWRCLSDSYDLSSDLNAYLGSYGANGSTLKVEVGNFKNRISIQFELLYKDGQEFYLDDIPKYKKYEPIQKSKTSVDKGLLCPPHCP